MSSQYLQQIHLIALVPLSILVCVKIAYYYYYMNNIKNTLKLQSA